MEAALNYPALALLFVVNMTLWVARENRRRGIQPKGSTVVFYLGIASLLSYLFTGTLTASLVFGAMAVSLQIVLYRAKRRYERERTKTTSGRDHGTWQ